MSEFSLATKNAKSTKAEWKKCRLGEVADLSWGDTSTTKDKYVAQGFLAYSGSGPDGMLPYADYDRVGVVLCAIGANCGLSWLAKEKWSCIKNTMRFWSIDKDVDTEFLFWSTRGKTFWPKRGSAQPFISQEDARNVIIALPPLPTQRKIAAVLGALDDKIENNRKICANLEAQAQAIFKSWFVDFEPFGGKMPQGWKMGKLGDVAEITMGQSPDGKSLNDVDDGITFFQGRAEFGNRFPTKRLSTTEPNRMAKVGDVLLSVRAPVGDLNIALEDCCIGRGLAAIRSKAGSQSFIYCLLKTLKPAFDLYEGAGTIFGSINKDSLHGLDVVIPEGNWIYKFESVVSSLDRMIREGELETRALAATRDALLPKLMSGEIDVEKVKVA